MKKNDSKETRDKLLLSEKISAFLGFFLQQISASFNLQYVVSLGQKA